MRLRRWLTIVLVSIIIGVGIVAAAIAATRTPAPPLVPVTPTVQPQEDDPGWDCTTQGNRECGPPRTCARFSTLTPPPSPCSD